MTIKGDKMKKKTYYTKKDIQKAGYNLTPLRCPKCKDTKEPTYNQYTKSADCPVCGHTW